MSRRNSRARKRFKIISLEPARKSVDMRNGSPRTHLPGIERFVVEAQIASADLSSLDSTILSGICSSPQNFCSKSSNDTMANVPMVMREIAEAECL